MKRRRVSRIIAAIAAVALVAVRTVFASPGNAVVGVGTSLASWHADASCGQMVVIRTSFTVVR